MRRLDDVLNALLGPDAAAAVRNATPVSPSGYVPTDLARKRIEMRLRQGRFDDLLRIEQRWVRERLLPSLTCFGCYPPPGAREADLALEDHS